MTRTRHLALALLTPLLVTGCVAVAPTVAPPPRDGTAGRGDRPAAERVVPPRAEGDLVESGREKSRKGKDKDENGGEGEGESKGDGKPREGKGKGKGEGPRLRAQGQGGPAARPPAVRRGAEGNRRAVPPPPRAGRTKPPAVRARPVRPRKHTGHRSAPRSGFRMGEWCRQAHGVASRDIVSLCHRAYGR
ncbi:hypothetical protein [Streptomyces chilikensis]|uniref:Lipoprotein n=1 Tax=Streptomyces chilikensis TaxID=1194079 RepID=A0ABV3EHN9_9ACTN